ncbi:hypothetical protein EVAR_38048_1 [Eumeta japonica]|uniref:Uncharacterized protein n=1 Tax=Eumeta variegata TaxID=151549 RepID=A0A4C1WAX0_EUMVA|nr:hypothetical protein EVAR_38048_1 [Eumeta japonica]
MHIRVAKMGERHKEAGIDQNTSMHIAQPHRGGYMCSSTQSESRTLRVLAYKIERTRKRSFANSRKSSRRSLKSYIDPSARIASGAVGARWLRRY